MHYIIIIMMMIIPQQQQQHGKGEPSLLLRYDEGEWRGGSALWQMALVLCMCALTMVVVQWTLAHEIPPQRLARVIVARGGGVWAAHAMPVRLVRLMNVSI